MTQSFPPLRPRFTSCLSAALVAVTLSGCPDDGNEPSPPAPMAGGEHAPKRPDVDPEAGLFDFTAFSAVQTSGWDPTLGRDFLPDDPRLVGEQCLEGETVFVRNGEAGFGIAPESDLDEEGVYERLLFANNPSGTGLSKNAQIREFAQSFAVDELSVNSLEGVDAVLGSFVLGESSETPAAASCGERFVRAATLGAGFYYGMRIQFEDAETRAQFVAEFGHASPATLLRDDAVDLEDVEDFLTSNGAELELAVVQLGGIDLLTPGEEVVLSGCATYELEACVAWLDHLHEESLAFLDSVGTKDPTPEDLQGLAVVALDVVHRWW